ncbi:hypothetical protein BCV70DRAFT_51838 [Testicularia cyperi]|uniref:Uncharacterized protein n=1 Tax=Testicularia cyperi TaxID=1882483 RepID=A0A317XUT9_9BASI|nr:hypothetical protein BCV70DRAFT_51838 [Testicularia cyperi]
MFDCCLVDQTMVQDRVMSPAGTHAITLSGRIAWALFVPSVHASFAVSVSVSLLFGSIHMRVDTRARQLQRPDVLQYTEVSGDSYQATPAHRHSNGQQRPSCELQPQIPADPKS